jgi:hypothetical protein
MALYLISYDLMNHKTFGQYETLIAELRRIGAQRILLSEWIVRSSSNSAVLRDSLLGFIHADDRFLVCEISETNWASWKTLISIRKL